MYASSLPVVPRPAPRSDRQGPDRAPELSRAGLALVALGHVLVVWGLLRANVVTLPEPLAVLTVSLLPPSPTVTPTPEITPPRPKPVAPRPRPAQQPVPLAAEASPAPAVAAVPPPLTFDAPPAPPAPPAPAQTIQPRFDADYLDNPKPPYPAISRRLGEQGRVVLRVQVLADGRVGDIQLHAPSGSPRLDQSALDTVRRWKFVPARRGSEAVAAWVLVPIAFSLKE